MHGTSNIKIITNNAHGIIYWSVTYQAVLAGPRKLGSRGPTGRTVAIFRRCAKKWTSDGSD